MIRTCRPSSRRQAPQDLSPPDRPRSGRSWRPRRPHADEGARAGDAEEHPAGALDARLEQRRGDGRRAASVARFWPDPADAHQAAPRAHDGAHVGEVEVDLARHGDQVGDALDALAQHVVGHAEGLRGSTARPPEEAVVRDHQQRVHLRRESSIPDSACSARCGPRSEGPGDDAQVRRPLAGELGDHGRSAGAGAAAQAGGHEHHVRTGEGLAPLRPSLQRGGAPT